MHQRLKIALACKNSRGGKGRMSLNQITLQVEHAVEIDPMDIAKSDYADIHFLMSIRNLSEAVMNFGMTKVTWDKTTLKIVPTGFKMNE